MIFPLLLARNLLIIIVVFSCSSNSSKLSSSRSSRKAYYGSTCSSTIKCDIHSLLHCEENVCQCLYPDAMIYNADLGTCVSLVNEICGYLETQRVFINCVGNAYCDQQQGVCKCTQGYIEGERHCMKQKGYGESCHSDNECMSELSLTCFEEVCKCDSNRFAAFSTKNISSVPSELKTTKCVTLAGLPCTAKTGCVRKASCVSETENGANIPSSTFGWMHPGICKCDFGYEIDENRYCRGKFGSNCDVLANVPCVEKFQCLDGICHCKYPDDQVFVEETGRCASLVGGPCTGMIGNELPSDDDDDEAINKEEIFCGQFMECRNATCSCKNGFVENLSRGCDLSYGQFCTGENMSKCDAAAGLHCVDGRCTCKDRRKEYDMKGGRCVGNTGSSCKIYPALSQNANAVINSVEIDDGKLPCSENMKCQTSRTQLEGLSSFGFCTPSKGGDDGGTFAPTTEERKGHYGQVFSGYQPEINDVFDD